MKIRKDFVTNSSSSSFVIAKHKDFSRQDFDDIIAKNEKNISLLMKWFKKSKEEIIEVIDDEFNGASADLVLGDWEVYGGRCSNEGYIYEAFLYQFSDPKNEHFKMRFC